MFYNNSRFFSGHILVVTMVLFYANLVEASVTFNWDPSPEPNIIGYRLHYGTQPNTYIATLNVGNHTSKTLTDLRPGNTYYMAVTAYNAAGESGYSNEVSVTIPNEPSNTPSNIPEVQLNSHITSNESGSYLYHIEVYGQPGQSGKLETSDDLIKWTTAENFIIDETGIYRYLASEIELNQVSKKFYRVVTGG